MSENHNDEAAPAMPLKEDIEFASPTSAGYGISAQELNEINEGKSKEGLQKHGGVAGLAQALCTDLKNGLSTTAPGDTSIQGRKDVFGPNAFKKVPGKSFFWLLFEQLQDSTLIMLMLAALISTVLGAVIPEERAENGWSEGVAIFFAVIVVSCVGAGNDYQKDIQFRKLNEQKDTIEVKVIRDGQQQLVVNTDVVVGEILVLDTGDKVIADGIATEAHGLVIDEASLTGESDPMKKSVEAEPWCRAGTQVTEGSGRIVVTAVGEHSEWGKTMALVVGEAGETPLQEKLTYMAGAIGKVGLSVAAVCFCVLLIRWCVENQGFPVKEIAQGPLAFFIFAITIVVVAVPEGLPLAVTISLAYSMKKMMRDNNFVRVLAACETMGGATAICSDKTGTLTENRMTVVEGWFAGRKLDGIPTEGDMPASLFQEMLNGIALNSKAFLIEHEKDTVEFVGNRTECALLMLMRKWGRSYEEVREKHRDDIEQLYGFSSEKKMAGILIRQPGGSFRLYNKGAAEIIVDRCISLIDETGSVVAMTSSQKAEMLGVVTGMAERGLRTLCLTYRDFPADSSRPADYFTDQPDSDFVMCGIVGIKDPVRKEVPDAVATCKRAGIVVRMVTGDNIHTAKHIARECGILLDGGLALEGPVFRKMPWEEIEPLLPKLQVLARSSPQDKYILVQYLQKLGEVVAVTGDGTNDAPALKESDVGLAMGIAGTEVAKEAADIVIMDDNFSSIVKSVLWGRSVFNNIRKFLQFQLTVNFVALVVAFTAAVTNGETPLTVMQLLWVNLIMDSMGALALATEDPTPDLLLNKPHGRTEPLISRKMRKHIIVQGCYQIFILFLIIYGAPRHLPAYELPGNCPAYSRVSTSGIALNNVTVGVPANPGNLPLFVENTGHVHDWWPLEAASDQKHLDVCCTTDASKYSLALPCDIALGGLYKPDEPRICEIVEWRDGGTKPRKCNTRRSEKHQGEDIPRFCGEEGKCVRFLEMKDLGEAAFKQTEKDREHGQEKYNSIVFNAFIFLQVFNEINARKINDEYNVFAGFFKSHVFSYVILITVGLQVIIVETKVATFFKVDSQDVGEWFVAIGIGAGALVVSFLTKVVTRLVERRPLYTSRSAVQAL